MCGGAIIFDYIPARRRVSAADFWPDSEADAEDSHAPRASGERGRHSASISGFHFFLCSASFLVRFTKGAIDNLLI